MHIGLQNVLQQDVEVGEVLEDGVLVGIVELWHFAERTNAIVYRSIGYLREIL